MYSLEKYVASTDVFVLDLIS